MREGILVVGDGPAGSALAAACATIGLRTRLLSPDPQRVWPATYGAWIDDVQDAGTAKGAALGLSGIPLWQRRYDDPIVAFDGHPPQGIGRPYGLLDNAVLRDHLRQRLMSAGGEVRTGHVRSVQHTPQGSSVTLDDGEVLAADLVVDATGHRPALADAGADADRGPALQVAHGIVAQITAAPVPAGGMAFMDWRTPDGAAADPPTFLYAMDLGGGRVFVEETSLASRPPLALPVLEDKLRQRLAAAGAMVGDIESQETVAFPMGVAVPRTDQRVVAYGAAAGMVHPATGYQVAAALRRAPAVAWAIADALSGGHDAPAVAAAAWAAVWPDDLLRQRALHAYGLEVLLGLNARDTQRFFRAFFSLPAADWHAYVSGATSSRELARVMLAVVRRLPPRLALRVTSGAFGADGIALARASFSGG